MSEFSSHNAVEEPIDTMIQVLHGNHKHIVQWIRGELPGGDLIYGDWVVSTMNIIETVSTIAVPLSAYLLSAPLVDSGCTILSTLSFCVYEFIDNGGINKKHDCECSE